MSFRRKLLILLLVIALVPLLLNSLLYRITLRKISQQLTTETRDMLQDNATQQLQALVNNQFQLLKKDRAFVLQALETQAREIEGLLARKARMTASGLQETYLFVQQQQPQLFLWQASYLESGLKAAFPENAISVDEPPDWYLANQESLGTSWQLKLDGRDLQLITAKTILQPNGDFAGVTAMALNYQKLFSDWQLPHPWQEQGRLFVVNSDPLATATPSRFKVLFEILPPDVKQASALSPQKHFVAATNTSSIDALIEALQKNRSGVLTQDFANKESLWVYAADVTDDTFVLLIIPRELITLPATKAADYVEGQFISGLKWTALLSVAALLWVMVTAIFRARAVTKPVAQLVQASVQLSRGDFATQVEIHTKDEFETLGHAFNRIGPQLKEHQQIKQSLAIAMDIQQLILPTEVPQLEDFELAGRLDYCDETGGDYYDFIETGSGKWGLVVGDVVGHGIGAALLMASAAGILHAGIDNGEENLETLFSSLNTFLEKDVGDTRFMTLFFALLDPTNHSLHWLSAGHGPMFLYRAESKEVEELDATTMPLGIMDDVEFKPVRKITLASGDMLAIGTDGIWETINSDGEMFGSERVGQLLKNTAKNSAEEIVTRILLAVDEFCGQAPKDDDLTLIILKAK